MSSSGFDSDFSSFNPTPQPDKQPQTQWWRDAVIYQIYPRSFAGSTGPNGTLTGITARLEHVAKLGADAVWLSPFYTSPQKDGGYDVQDYRNIDPMYGTLADADRLIEHAHALGLKIIVDLVPNHTSDQHPWFQAALAAGPGSPERERYWFRDTPNDWQSIFGQGAWTQVCQRPDAPGSPWEHDTSWYLHLFDSTQPDLNWTNEDVHEEFAQILRFWLDRGVDGFRVDVAHGMAKDPELPDWQFHFAMVEGGDRSEESNVVIPDPPMWDREEVHEIHREWRAILNEYSPARILVAEAWVDPDRGLAKYVRPDEMHQAFNFDFLVAKWTPEVLAPVITRSLKELATVGALPTWVMSNHDVVRAASRLGLAALDRPNGIRPTDPQPDAELGAKRALAAHALMEALPGSVYIYQGEELNLPEHTQLPDSVRQDPAYFRTLPTDHPEPGRDGCRIPLPWVHNAPAFGFSDTGETWLPQPEEYGDFAVDVQEANPDSALHFFRKMIRLRKQLGLGQGAAENIRVENGTLRLRNLGVEVVTTFDHPYPAPEGAVLLSTQEVVDGVIPPNTTAWIAS
ncbi:glycoside hydrolase family 13 protein [Corynebacterium kozikiae]|uniref:glycoside hydrolase family 13 protein n=1 Tax=Corynebacterium kozikiae TaxID=2968469 RepID=UPI00211BF4CA|nr:glycoside hydrolase family 13 protein [Corynebacterium sp. 76QC2CO]MCQ9342578.1 glycoside hydrolase family 13 protein [Corynebacterium sp. 76QC2CO]